MPLFQSIWNGGNRKGRSCLKTLLIFNKVSMQHGSDSNLNWRLEDSHSTFSNWNRFKWICFDINIFFPHNWITTHYQSELRFEFEISFFLVPFISQSNQFIMGRKPKQNYASKCFHFKFRREAIENWELKHLHVMN